MKKLWLILSFIAVSGLLNAQNSQFNAQFSIGPQVKLNGIGLYSNLSFKTAKSTYRQPGIDLTISNLRDSRENKTKSDLIPNPQSFIYGKKNRVFNINPSLNYKVQAGNAFNNSPIVSYGVSVGPSFAFTRPVYVYIVEFAKNENARPMLHEYDDAVHAHPETIQGDAGWTKGFSNLTSYTGIKASVYGELMRNRDFSERVLTVGAELLYYPQGIEIMHGIRNHAFATLFFAYQFSANL